MLNLKVHFSRGTISYQFMLSKENYHFLDHDSYIDCSQLFIYGYDEVMNLREGKNPTILGKLIDNYLNSVIELIKQAPTIKKIHKETFGFN